MAPSSRSRLTCTTCPLTSRTWSLPRTYYRTRGASHSRRRTWSTCAESGRAWAAAALGDCRAKRATRAPRSTYRVSGSSTTTPDNRRWWGSGFPVRERSRRRTAAPWTSNSSPETGLRRWPLGKTSATSPSTRGSVPSSGSAWAPRGAARRCSSVSGALAIAQHRARGRGRIP